MAVRLFLPRGVNNARAVDKAQEGAVIVQHRAFWKGTGELTSHSTDKQRERCPEWSAVQRNVQKLRGTQIHFSLTCNKWCWNLQTL